MKSDLETGLIQTVAGTGDSGWSGDGALACAACLNEPKSLSIDAEGNLFIADSENHVVRKIDMKTQCIKTVAGAIQRNESGAKTVSSVPVAEGVDGDPFAESGTVNLHAVTQQSDLSGTVRFIATGTAPVRTLQWRRWFCQSGPAKFPNGGCGRSGRASLYCGHAEPSGAACGCGTGVITTVAGLGRPRFFGDGGLAVEAGLSEPAALALSDEGILYIADQSNNRVRAVDLATGVIRTVAGTGHGWV